MLLNIGFLLGGLVLTVIGAEYFIAGAALIARRFGIPKLIIGLTVVALGTSAPELGINILSSIEGHSALALGNILGSNIANTLFIFGSAALFARTIHISKDSLTQVSIGVLVMFFLYLLTIVNFGQAHIISQLEGLALVTIGAFYWFYLYRITKRDTDRQEEEELAEGRLAGIKSMVWVGAITLLSLVGLLIGARFATSGAVFLAHSIGMSELLISSTIIAFGTSLPELVTGVQAIRQKQYDLMLGNIVGSNIVNVLFILGLSSLVRAIPVGSEAELHLSANSLAAILLLVGFTAYKPRTFPRWGAFIFLALYLTFLVIVLY